MERLLAMGCRRVSDRGALLCAASAFSLVLVAHPAPAQVGATINGTVVVSSGERTIEGSTTINTSSGPGANVTGGVLTLDPQAGASPGPIVVNSRGHALLVNGGGSIVVKGPAVSLTPGGIQGMGLAAIGGGVEAVGTSINSGVLGVGAKAGGNISLSRASISVGGAQAVGVGAEGGRVDIGEQTSLGASGVRATGIYLRSGGQVSAPANVAISLQGGGGVGLMADGSSASFTGLGVNISGGGGSTSGVGVAAINGGAADLVNLMVGGGDVGAGVWARDGSSVTLTGSGTQIDVTAGRNLQILSYAASSTMFNKDLSFTPSTASAASARAGLLASGGTISADGATINASASGASGAHAGLSPNLSQISISNSTVSAGDAGYTLRAEGNARITAANSRIYNVNGYAALYGTHAGADAAPSILVSNSEVRAQGPNSSGIAGSDFTTQATPIRIEVSGGGVTSLDEYAIYGMGRLDVILSDGVEVSGGTALLRAAAASSAAFNSTLLRVTASNGSLLLGDALADEQSEVRLDLAGSEWRGASIGAPSPRWFGLTHVGLDATGRWEVTADSVVRQDLANAGEVAFAAPSDPASAAGYKRLTTHDYVGAGGVVAFNTRLGLDDSPTDLLVIDGGAATGSSAIRVANAGGAGAITVGDGIRLVQAVNGGATEAGAFTSPVVTAPIVGGPYEYLLFRGGRNPADFPDDWFLRSTLNCGAPGAPPPPICPAPPTPDPPTPPGPPTPPSPPTPPTPPTPSPPTPTRPTPTPPSPPQPIPDPEPNVREEVSLYVAVPALARLYAWQMVDTLHERVGEEEQLRGRGDIGEDRGAWARAVYWSGKRRGAPAGVLQSEGPKFDFDIKAVQAGFDVVRNEDEKGRRHFIGLFGGYGRVDGGAVHFNGIEVGRNEIDAYALGFYWTHFRPNDAYLDAVLMLGWNDATAKSRRLPELRVNIQTLTGSLEGGWPFELRRGWRLEPQAQLVYHHAYDAAGFDAGGRVRFDGQDSLIGRLGLRLAKTWNRAEEDEEPRRTTAWARIDLWHEFLDPPGVTFEAEDRPVSFTSDTGQDWLKVGGSLTRQMSRKSTLYGDVGYAWDLQDQGHAWTAKLGVRFNW